MREYNLVYVIMDIYQIFLDSYSGVKQGEPLSPLLFILFINDLYENLVIQDDGAFTLNDLKISILLFADDTVLISYTPHGLQNLIDQLQTYYTEWGITVNTDKTVVMVFKQGTGSKILICTTIANV